MAERDVSKVRSRIFPEANQTSPLRLLTVNERDENPRRERERGKGDKNLERERRGWFNTEREKRGLYIHTYI